MILKSDDKLREMFKSVEGLETLKKNIDKLLSEKQKIDTYINNTMQHYQIDAELAEQITSDAFDHIHENLENLDENTPLREEILTSIDTLLQNHNSEIENTEHLEAIFNQDTSVTLEEIERVSTLLRSLHNHTDEMTKKGQLDIFEGVLIKESLGLPYEQFTSKLDFSNTTAPNIKLDGFEVSVRPIISATPEQKEKAFKKLIIGLSNELPKPDHD